MSYTSRQTWKKNNELVSSADQWPRVRIFYHLAHSHPLNTTTIYLYLDTSGIVASVYVSKLDLSFVPYLNAGDGLPLWEAPDGPGASVREVLSKGHNHLVSNLDKEGGSALSGVVVA